MLPDRVGREMSKKILMRSIVRFFTAFDRSHTSSTLPASASPKSLDAEDLLTVEKRTDAAPEPCKPANAVADGDACNEQLTAPNRGNERTTASQDATEAIKTQALKELREVLTPELAYFSYYPFCRFLGARCIDDCLPNHELLRSLCIQYDETLQNDAAESITEGSLRQATDATLNSSRISSSPFNVCASPSLSESSINCSSATVTNVTGNRINISEPLFTEALPQAALHLPSSIGFCNSVDISMYLSNKMNNTQRHLQGNWLAYWNHEIGRSDQDTNFNLNHIKLQSFVGHTNSIKSLVVLDNENSFMSCSKDKTVKLWSLRNQGDGSALCPPQFTYTGE